MNIAVFGATGGTGQEVVRQALAQGYNVTAFVRDPRRLRVEDRRLRVVVGDALDPQCVVEAVANQDALIITLGSQPRKDLTVCAKGTANVIRAMKAHGVPRLIVVSAGGVGDSYWQAPLMLKAIIKTILKNPYADHELQERYVRDSALEWVIVRPAKLSDGPATGRFDNGTPTALLPKWNVTRADVACFVLQQLTNDRYLRQAVSIP